MNIPEILYKYRTFNERTINMLANNQVYFASPLEFNDPFDCLAQKNKIQNFRQGTEALIRANAGQRGFTQEQIQAAIERINAEMAEDIAETDAADSEYKEYVHNQLGVLSLSSCNDSILMWSHYADFHKGFCIGFKTNSFGFPGDAIKEVIYTEEINKNFILEFFLSQDSSEERYIDESEKMEILTKYIDWKYEKEWRVKAIKGLGTYPDSGVGEIIFGLRMDDNHKNILREILKNKNVAFFQAVEGANEFMLEIRPVD
jgi:hypothetical protein